MQKFRKKESIMLRKILALPILSLALSMPALAENNQYFGATYKFIEVEAPDLGVDIDTHAPGLIYGRKLSDNIGLEFSYLSVSDIEIKAISGGNNGSLEINTINIGALYYPNGWTNGLFVEAAYSMGDAKLDINSYSGDEDDGVLLLGVGYDISVADSGILRFSYQQAEYEDLGTIDTTAFGISALLKF
jgi:hypothetical protein